MTISGFVIPVISQSSLIDPPFVVYVIFSVVAMTMGYISELMYVCM